MVAWWVVGVGGGEQGYGGDGLDRAGRDDQLLRRKAPHQVWRELGAGDEADGVGGEDQAVEPRRGVVQLDEDEGGAGDVAGEGQLHAGDRGHRAGEAGVGQQTPIDLEHPRQLGVGPVFEPPRFGDQEQQATAGQAIGGSEPEHIAPGDHLDQAGAEDGRQDGAQAQDQHAQGQQARGLVAGVGVADDGRADGDGGAGAHPLQAAGGDQHRGAGGHAAGERGQHIEHHPAHQRRFAADPVRQGTIEGLADGEADEESGHAHFDLALGRVQLTGDGRQGRQVHVDGHGPGGAQRPQHDGVTGHCLVQRRSSGPAFLGI
jgi:hypothetical protein